MNKKNIVFLVGEYKPNMSPNGKIVSLLCNELADKCNITVISRKNVFHLKSFEISKFERIIRISDYNQSINSFLAEMLRNSSGLPLQILRILMFLRQVVFWIPRALRTSSVSSYFVKKIVHTMNKYLKNERIDAVIACSAPHEEIFAATKWCKETGVPLYVFQMDRFVNANSLYPFSVTKTRQKRNNIKMEKEVLQVCKRLFVLPPLRNYYRDDQYKLVQNKIITVEHPLVARNINYDIPYTKESNDVIITYAGSLDRKLRNPEHLLKIMSSSKVVTTNLKLQLFSFGNCEELINTYSSSSNNSILQMGKVSSEEISKKLRESTILLIIGNNSDEEIPSKLFEYLGYGKPIIHLYFSEMDKYLDYLSRYPKALCLKIDDCCLDSNINKFIEFCNDSKDFWISNREVVSLYKECTPTYVANIFNEEIEKNSIF